MKVVSKKYSIIAIYLFSVALFYNRNDAEVKYSDHIKNLEDECENLRRIIDEISPDSLMLFKTNLKRIEEIITRKTKDLEQIYVLSTSVSCSSPSEDLSVKDHLDGTRCSTPDEMIELQKINLPISEVDRLHEKISRHSRAEEMVVKLVKDLKMQLKNHKKTFEEIQTERDVLLERVDLYLKENSCLKTRLEEQRCKAALLQRQLNADLESKVNFLETEIDKLNQLCHQKDKQIRDIKEVLENTTKALKVREEEVTNKSKEENLFISMLKVDLSNALNDKEKLEKNMEVLKEKLKNSSKVPFLIETMIEEKNAEIDRLQTEVTRLSNEKSIPSLLSSELKPLKLGQQIKFSEPDSFGECLSSISPHNPSVVRHCSDSYVNFRNHSFSIRQCSTKIESLSSIGSLQLSPRGTDLTECNNWKMSSVINPIETKDKSTETNAEGSSVQSRAKSREKEDSEIKKKVKDLEEELSVVNQEVAVLKLETSRLEKECAKKEAENMDLLENEKTFIEAMESLKTHHASEVEELQRKMSFERKKVEKVYEEIKSLEVKKIEIEEAFLSLKEDYNDKLDAEHKLVENYREKIKDVEFKNEELKKEINIMREKVEVISEELKEKNEIVKTEQLNKNNTPSVSRSKRFVEAEVQVQSQWCELCKNNLVLETPMRRKQAYILIDSFDYIKTEFNKIINLLSDTNFNQNEVCFSLIRIKTFLSSILNKINDVSHEGENQTEKVTECSVDDLTIKVQRELLISAKLDNELLSSLEGKACLARKEDSVLNSGFIEIGGDDGIHVIPRKFPSMKVEEKENFSQALAMYKETTKKIMDLENDKDDLEDKIKSQEKVIKVLQKDLLKEKKMMMEERERCKEDAKIMELLRLKLEKGLEDLKSKDKDLKTEKERRISLERELEMVKKEKRSTSESKKVVELNRLLKFQEEKISSLNNLLEKEVKRRQDLRLLLEENKIKRQSEKQTHKLVEGDLVLSRDQKQNLMTEVICLKKALSSRDTEIKTLKQKLSVQDFDLKALRLSNDSSVMSEKCFSMKNSDKFTETLKGSDLFKSTIHQSLLHKMKKLNACVERHVEESNEMGESLLLLSEETQLMRDLINQIEEKIGEKILPDIEIERKLWSLEKSNVQTELERLKGEYDKLIIDIRETCNENEILRSENIALKTEIASLEKERTDQLENCILKERIAYLTNKYLRSESYRKALAWEKKFLMISLKGSRLSEEEASRKLEKLGLKEKNRKSNKFRPGKFKVLALSVLAIFRMKYVVRRWQRQKTVGLLPPDYCLTSDFSKKSGQPSTLNFHRNPIDPLSYQTQNIFRPTSSRVLRTPPCRDPGMKLFSRN